MNLLINFLTKTRLLKGDLDYHLVRASMVILYFFFGYQKWFDYEAKGLFRSLRMALSSFGCIPPSA